MSVLTDFLKYEKLKPKSVLFHQPIDQGKREWTFEQAGKEIRCILAGLQGLGLKPGDHVALISKNCAEWIMADIAIMMGGYVSIPLYPTLGASSIKPIIEHSDSKAIIIGKLDDYTSQKDGIPPGIAKIGIRSYGVEEQNTWEDWVQNMTPSDYIHEWKPEDRLTIIYTSGTTGNPKGVLHALNNFDSTVKSAIKELEINPNLPARMFSYLPLSHIAERIGIENMGMHLGAEFHFAQSLDTFAANLAEAQPTLFFAVPRIWAKFKEKIEEKLPPQKMNTLLKIPFVKNIIKKSIKKKLGLATATHIFSGAAPISVDLLKWFSKLDIRILQAYGMTEDSVYAHFNRNSANKLGTVGIPFSGLDVKIADTGEIRVKSPGNTQGYYKEPNLTAELFDEEGYLRTGDIGERDKEGFLTITGRVKDQFKTDKGKYVSPAPIEMMMLANSDIEGVCVVGMGVPQPMALIVPSAAGLAKTREALSSSIVSTLNSVNEKLEAYEKLKKLIVMKEPWTIENGLLTPTMKVKRNEVEKIHLSLYPEWYNMQELVVWER
jgi:long-chain acyl-CoA synthetase